MDAVAHNNHAVRQFTQCHTTVSQSSRLAVLHAGMPAQSKCDRVATWEHVTDGKIAHNNAMREFAALKAERDAQLDARRAELAQKLYNEEQALQQVPCFVHTLRKDMLKWIAACT